MHKYHHVHNLVEKAYTTSPTSFGLWMWKNHVPIVALYTEELCKKYTANPDLAVAGALLHDLGDAFVHRHADEHEDISRTKAIEILTSAEYSQEEIQEVIEVIIAPHSCKDGFFPASIEGKVLATADALAHLTTDFYVQFTWMHLPENKTYEEFIKWVTEKLDRDFHNKIFFDEVRSEVKARYEALVEVYVTVYKQTQQ